MNKQWKNLLLSAVLGAFPLCSINLIFSEKTNALAENGAIISAYLVQVCVPEPLIISQDACIDAGYDPNDLTPPYAWVVDGLWLLLDPPVQEVTSFSLEFFFNPEHFSPILGSAGFFCSFTNTGSCPVLGPGIGTQPIEITAEPIIPGSAIGNSSINIGSNSVSVDVTFSSPITGQSEDEIFFGMAFQPLFEVTGNTRVIYSRELLPNASYSLTSFSCTTLNGQNECGSDNFTRSFRVEKTNEPTSTLSFLALGTLGAASTLKRKIKPSQSTEKETTKVG